MGKYTALDDPLVDQTIESHMQSIVEIVRLHMEPRAIILRGSFGRGEGSVLSEGGEIAFLSDYEIDIVTKTSAYRKLLKSLSRQLTSDLKVDTSLRWQRPDFMTRMRIGPVTVGKAEPTISLYELQYGGRTLSGEDFFDGVKKIEPGEIILESGLLLLLNRMAESMMHLPTHDAHSQANIYSYYWVNKTILACIESLLLVWGQYHYSYEERGKRFPDLAHLHLRNFPDGGEKIVELSARATAFKLKPRPDLYTATVKAAWEETFPEVLRVLQVIIKKLYGISVNDFTDFPKNYLNLSYQKVSLTNIVEIGVLKLLDLYRSGRKKVFPPALLSSRILPKYVYAVVPVLFQAQFTEDCGRLLTSARKWMAPLGKLEEVSPEITNERAYLTKRLTWFWKVYCHG